MATSDRCEVEATICATVSDNEAPATMTTLPKNSSEDSVQCRASGETTTPQRMEEEKEHNINKEDRSRVTAEKESPGISDKEVKTPPLSFFRLRSFRREDSTSDTSEPRTPEVVEENKENMEKESKCGPLSFMKVSKLKREKSNSEILERKKKRVKFSPNDDDDDVMVDTRVFEPQVVSSSRITDDETDGDVSSKIKKLLKRRPRKNKSTIETQTEEERKKEIENNVRLEPTDNKNLDIQIPSSIRQDTTVNTRIHSEDVDACSHDISSPENDYTNASALNEPLDVREQYSSGITAHNDAKHRVFQEVNEQEVVPCPEHQTENRLSLQSHSHEGQPNHSKVTSTVNVTNALAPEKATLHEEQELEISGGKDIAIQDQPTIESIYSASLEDDETPTTSQGTAKRERTFTLDGPPPAKITRSSCDVAEEITLPKGNTPPRDSVMEPLQPFVNVNETGEAVDQDIKEKERKPVKCVRIVEPEVNKKQEETNSTVRTLKNNAKKTLVCAWRSALKSPETSDKIQNPPPKLPVVKTRNTSRPDSTVRRSSPTKTDNSQRSSPTKQVSASRSSPAQDKSIKVNLQRKTSDPKQKNTSQENTSESKSPKESPRLSRPIKRTPHKHPDSPRTPPERTSVWAGMSLSSFKREGTFTKKYDSERDRLQAECYRLNVDKDRLQSELEEARRRLDDEVAARKALKRNNELSLRQLKEGEIKRSETLIAELRNRLEQMQQQQPAKQCCHANEREAERLNRDLSTLRDCKKRLEEAVQNLQESERKRAGELRRLHEEHESDIAKIHKINKSDAAKLLDELRSKERTISNLEKQVSSQSAKIRLQEEKQRELSNDRSEDGRKQMTRGGGSSVSSKKQKDGTKTREKESSSSSISTSSNISTNSTSAHSNTIVILHPSAPPAVDRDLLSAVISPMEQSMESGISMTSDRVMPSEIEDLRQQLENARKEIEEFLAENNNEDKDDLRQQFDNAKKEVEDLLLKQGEQDKEIEENLVKIREQKEIIEEQQMKITDLTEEAMDRECMVLASQPVWPPKIIESCVKVCELPTVIEQSSDEEFSPTSSPTTPDPSHLHDFDDHSCYDEELVLPPTPSTPGDEHLLWPQVHESPFSSQLSRVSEEWQKLLASTSTASSPSVDLGEKEYLSGGGVWSSSRLMELENENTQLKADLQEARDQADLLEFTVLELTEGADRASESGVGVDTTDQSTSTDLEELTLPPPTIEDLSLPLSIDSGLDISNDYKARVTEGRAWLARLCESDPASPAAQHLAALLDWVATIPTHHGLSLPMSPTLTTTHPMPTPKMGGEEPLEGTDDIGRDLMILATRLQESLNDPAAQEPLLLDTIAKLRVLDASLSQLQERVVSLTEENRELQEAVTTLSDAHETRTEASGTESELQLAHRKTPSFHSDMSDAESDSAEHSQQHHHHHHRSPSVKLASLEASSSFQESGIFDTSCDVVHVTTQTELTQIPDGDVLPDPPPLLLGHKSECELREAEVDLQSAVARLATIRSAVQGRDLSHLRLQELQESDEYLRTCLDERIVLSKLEYDSIVESERCLQRELEHLKCEKEQLGLDCETLKEQTKNYRARCGTDAEEAMKGEIRVLRQKLLVTERSRREVFEEKCELEEEENDARLRVQRLESQMEAAREMENLLSASLSQEQEISRELHRRVRELQILEKEHRGRLKRLEVVSQEAEHKAASLAVARDHLAMQLTFATYGLMLADSWRLMVPNPTAALVPFAGKEILKVPQELCPSVSPPLVIQALDNGETVRVLPDCDRCVCPPVMCDVCVQTYQEFPVVSASVQTEIEAHCVVANCPSQEDSSKGNLVTDHGQRRSAERDHNDEDEPLNKRLRSTRSQSTMTHVSSSLTDREQYYLEQIEGLQKEKMSLRKGQETDRRDSLQQHSDREGEMEDIRRELREAIEDRCTLAFRLEEAQDERDEIKRKYIQRIDELKGDMSRYKEMYEQEKKSLVRDYQIHMRELEKERDQKDERVHKLELQLNNFRQELEIVGVSIATDLVEFDNDMDNVLSQGKSSSLRRTDDGDLISKIRELAKSETALRQKIYDLEKKECAYRETIREADKIMSSHVTSYQQRIEDLETTIEQQIAKIQQLESSEERLRSSLRNNSRSSEGTRISDLLDRLIQTENSELKLKERVWTLEKSEKELQIKLMEGEKNNQSLRGELRDQEELVHRLRALETENNALSLELNQAQDSARKMSEVQQNECYLRGRVEELEVTENMLRETLHQADLILSQRERKLRDQISSLQEEVQTYKAQLEAAASKEYGARESEVSYRRQLEEMKSRLAEAEKELRESSSETMSHETQHRSEVTKLRNQLKLSNSQLTELDRLNCELRDRVLAAEAEGQRLAKELEEHGRRHEQDLITFNLQMSSRDSTVEELEHQLEQMSHAHAVSELDTLASSPIASLHSSITALTSALKNCKNCKETQSATLTEVTTQLGTLAELLEGQSNSDIDDIVSDTDEEDPQYAENLAQEATSTPPPNPAGEGPREHSSGDVLGCTPNGRLKRDSRRRSRRRLEEHSSRRLARPQGSTTILEELEEKVRELEEAVSLKEDEIRLADNENGELNTQLQKCDTALHQKGGEVEYLNSTLAGLRQQLMLTMEDYERSKLSLQAKHKVDVEQLTHQVERLTKEAERLACRGNLKDSIISTLAGQIRAILRSGNMTVVINQLRRLQDDQDKQVGASDDGENVSDFDVEAVCSLLSQPKEMVSLSQSTFLDGIELSRYVTSELKLSCGIQEPPSHVTCQRSPALVGRRKSRIPRYIPSPSLQRVKSAPLPVDRSNAAKSYLRMPQSPKVKVTTESERNKVNIHHYSPEKRFRKASENTQLMRKASENTQLMRKASENTQLMRLTATSTTFTMPVERLFSDTITATDSRGEMKVSSSSTSQLSESKAQIILPSAKLTGRKDSTRSERPARYLSDARKIKRMLTGVAPLDAAVDCAAAPEWRSRSPLGGTSDVEVSCVPRPQNLHITRRVGLDGVVIAWAPLEHDCVAGFQVLVGGRVVQHVRSPHRTKALVTGLPLAGSFTIGLVTMAEDGRCSTPVIVTQDRTRVYAPRNSSIRTLRRGVPSCL